MEDFVTRLQAQVYELKKSDAEGGYGDQGITIGELVMASLTRMLPYKIYASLCERLRELKDPTLPRTSTTQSPRKAAGITRACAPKPI